MFFLVHAYLLRNAHNTIVQTEQDLAYRRAVEKTDVRVTAEGKILGGQLALMRNFAAEGGSCGELSNRFFHEVSGITPFVSEMADEVRAIQALYQGIHLPKNTLARINSLAERSLTQCGSVTEDLSGSERTGWHQRYYLANMIRSFNEFKAVAVEAAKGQAIYSQLREITPLHYDGLKSAFG